MGQVCDEPTKKHSIYLPVPVNIIIMTPQMNVIMIDEQPRICLAIFAGITILIQHSAICTNLNYEQDPIKIAELGVNQTRVRSCERGDVSSLITCLKTHTSKVNLQSSEEYRVNVGDHLAQLIL